MEKNENYFAMEVIEQAKRNARQWFIAFLVMTAAFVTTNAIWILRIGN